MAIAMITRRRLLVLGLAGLPVGAAGLAVALVALRPEPGVTPENFRRLRIGMSEKEAEAILGGPGARQIYGVMRPTKTWTGDGCVIWLAFNSSDRDSVIGRGDLESDDGSFEELPWEPGD